MDSLEEFKCLFNSIQLIFDDVFFTVVIFTVTVDMAMEVKCTKHTFSSLINSHLAQQRIRDCIKL